MTGGIFERDEKVQLRISSESEWLNKWNREFCERFQKEYNPKNIKLRRLTVVKGNS
jgi:hypothetical protein